MSFAVTTVPLVLPFSNAHSLIAASICRILLMQALAGLVRFLSMKLGITPKRQKGLCKPKRQCPKATNANFFLTRPYDQFNTAGPIPLLQFTFSVRERNGSRRGRGRRGLGRANLSARRVFLPRTAWCICSRNFPASRAGYSG